MTRIKTIGMQRFRRTAYPWRYVVVWAFLMILWLAIIIRDSQSIPVWVMPLATFLAWGMFYIEYNASVFWNDEAVYSRERSLNIWHLYEQYFKLDEIIEVRSDALTHPMLRRRPFEHLVLATDSEEMGIALFMFHREEVEDFLKFLYEKAPNIFTDDHIVKFMNGEYEIFWMSKFSTYLKKDKELHGW